VTIAPEEELIYEHTVDGLVRAIGRRMTPGLRARLEQAGLAPAGKKASAYSHHTWRELLRLTREELLPVLSPEDGLRELGRSFVDGYFQTLLGSAVAGLVRLLGPRRTLQRATQNFRSANNFTETRLTEVGPNHYQLWMSRVGDPEFTAGLVMRGLEVAGARDLTVTVRPQGDGCAFDIVWK
jgi:uncharacterized protein (TIGR02265 family)